MSTPVRKRSSMGMGMVRSRAAALASLASIATLAALCIHAHSQETAASPAPANPAQEILRDECVSCHRPGKSKGGLKLHTAEALRAGGESGPALDPQKPAESLLLTVLAPDADPHMPPKKNLTATQIAQVKTWVEAGAPWDPAVMERPPKTTPVELQALPEGVAPALALAFSPDGSRIAMTRGARIELLDAKAPKLPLLSTIDAHREPVSSLAWRPDASTLASGGFRRVRFWNPADGSLAAEITEGIAGDVTALVWTKSGDGLWIADSLATRGGFVHRIAWPSRQIAKTWKAHEDSLYAMALSPDGKWLATAGGDKLARRWDTATDTLAAVYEGHTNHVLSVVFDPASSRLATSGADRELKVWDRDSREQDAALGDKRHVYPALAWSADGKQLAAVSDFGDGAFFSEILKHDGAQSAPPPKMRALPKTDAVFQCVAISPDGSQILAGSADGRLFGWTNDGKPLAIEPR